MASISTGATIIVPSGDYVLFAPSAPLAFSRVEVSGNGTTWETAHFTYFDNRERTTTALGRAASSRSFMVETKGATRVRFQGVTAPVLADVSSPAFASDVYDAGVQNVARAALIDIGQLASANRISTTSEFAVAPAGVVASQVTGLTAPGGLTTARRITNGTGATANIQVTWDLQSTFPELDFGAMRGIRVFVRPDANYNWTSPSIRCRVFVWGASDYDNGYKSNRIQMALDGSISTIDSGTGLFPGWQELVFDPDDFAADGGTPTKNMRISRIRVEFQAVPNGWGCDVAYFGSAPAIPGSYDLIFDDARISVYRFMGDFERFGVRPTIPIVSGQFEASPPVSAWIGEPQSAFMNIDQVRDAASRGAVFINHSRTHANYSAAGPGDVPTIRADFEACADWINANGLNYKNSALVVVLPFSALNSHVVAALEGSSYGFRTAYVAGHYDVTSGYQRFMGRVGMQARIFPDETAGVTLAETTAWLDRNLRKGVHVSFMGHKIGDIATDTITNTRAFIFGMMEHCRARGYVNMTAPDAVEVSRLYGV